MKQVKSFEAESLSVLELGVSLWLQGEGAKCLITDIAYATHAVNHNDKSGGHIDTNYSCLIFYHNPVQETT